MTYRIATAQLEIIYRGLFEWIRKTNLFSNAAS